MIGIICAMQVEIEKIKLQIQNPVEISEGHITFLRGQYSGKEIVAAVSGIGKVFAAICAQTMILKFQPSVIINVGVAGTLTSELDIGDVAVADKLVQHDMDTSPLGDPKGLISGINIVEIPCDTKVVKTITDCVSELGIHEVIGIIASGDQFIVDKKQKEYITEQFKAIACEMEGAAISQVCYVNKIPFGVIRAISDSANEQSHMDYPEFVKLAAANSAKVISKFIEKYAE